MTYQQTLDFLFNKLPMYQRIGAAAYKIDLSNTINLCNYLDNPETKFKSIHVAGTNGKGSTSHILSSILQEQGYKVGLYTSPHLLDFRERIKINGKSIPEQNVIDFVQINKDYFEQSELSFFEMTVGLAFKYFADKKVDIAVIETGLGGRLDSTNIITPEISVITNIGLDHTQFLGDTFQKIATEKAGIIKPNTPVIIGETQSETADIFKKIAHSLNAEITFADKEAKTTIETDLNGLYQQKNVQTAVTTINTLKGVAWNISERAIKNGCKNVVKNTLLRGRWETLSENPKTICDTGHNESGIQLIIEQLKSIPFNKLHFVLGMVNDKSIDTVLQLLPKDAEYYFTKASIPRALNEQELALKAVKMGLNGNDYSNVNLALKQAKANYAPNDLIFIGGSTFIVADALHFY